MKHAAMHKEGSHQGPPGAVFGEVVKTICDNFGLDIQIKCTEGGGDAKEYQQGVYAHNVALDLKIYRLQNQVI